MSHQAPQTKQDPLLRPRYLISALCAIVILIVNVPLIVVVSAYGKDATSFIRFNPGQFIFHLFVFPAIVILLLPSSFHLSEILSRHKKHLLAGNQFLRMSAKVGPQLITGLLIGCTAALIDNADTTSDLYTLKPVYGSTALHIRELLYEYIDFKAQEKKVSTQVVAKNLESEGFSASQDSVPDPPSWFESGMRPAEINDEQASSLRNYLHAITSTGATANSSIHNQPLRYIDAVELAVSLMIAYMICAGIIAMWMTEYKPGTNPNMPVYYSEPAWRHLIALLLFAFYAPFRKYTIYAAELTTGNYASLPSIPYIILFIILGMSSYWGFIYSRGKRFPAVLLIWLPMAFAQSSTVIGIWRPDIMTNIVGRSMTWKDLVVFLLAEIVVLFPLFWLGVRHAQERRS